MSNTPKMARKGNRAVELPEVAEVAEQFPVSILERVPLLNGLSPKGLLLARKVVKRRIFAPGEVLVSEDARGDTMFLLMEGAAKITVRKGAGTVLLGLCGKGELLGELAAIDGQARSATVVAQNHCEVGYLSGEEFWKYLWPLDPVPVNMAHLLVERVRRLTAKVQVMATLDVRSRLAYQIVLLAREHATEVADGGDVLPFGLTQAELAQMIGTSRVQVNQVMKVWNRAGILSARRNTFSIHRLDSLSQMFPASLAVIAPPRSRL